MEKRKSFRKGFASTVIAGIVAFLLVTAAATMQSASSHEKTFILLLEAQKTANAFDDSKNFFNATVNDVLVDAGWAAFGCTGMGGFNGEFGSKIGNYFDDSEEALDYEFANVSIESLQYDIDDAVPVSSGYTVAFDVETSFNLLVNASDVKKEERVTITKFIEFKERGEDNEFCANVGDGPTFCVSCSEEG